LVNNALGANPGTPDCSHPDFGEHITQASAAPENGYHILPSEVGYLPEPAQPELPPRRTGSLRPLLHRLAGSGVVTVPVGLSAQYWEWDLTAFVKNQITTGQRTMSLELQNDATTSDPVSFNSREAASNKPQLVVQP
jgi:hypothetical protein